MDTAARIAFVWAVAIGLTAVSVVISVVTGAPEPVIGGSIGCLLFAGFWTAMELAFRE